jgi:hypothetical protein
MQNIRPAIIALASNASSKAFFISGFHGELDKGFARQDIALAGGRLVVEVTLPPVGFVPECVRILALYACSNLADVISTEYCGGL